MRFYQTPTNYSMQTWNKKQTNKQNKQTATLTRPPPPKKKNPETKEKQNKTEQEENRDVPVLYLPIDSLYFDSHNPQIWLWEFVSTLN